ncbi:hypothetical protein QWY86_19910 [Pedobacter aquatilis]|uniref:hypothetical protein n=1 Tax=Pedobacter aquatilis TaxID=351343 RepID=UPI0025B44B72|nr:hypothetical protein [Pedobacter aquatilis]MDN3588953.1 hypothetical protein [Pedobacter aquatilis]
MKKLIFLLLIFPTIVFAQVRPGLYKFQLIPGNLKMELNNSNFIRVADDCRDRTPNCGKQVWQIVTTSINATTFKIILTGSGKYLTWDDPNENAIKLQLSLQPRYPRLKEKYQLFNFIINDKGSYQIQPAFDDATPNNFFLSATVHPGAYNAVGLFKKGETEFRNVQDAWIFTPPITPLAPQASPSVVVEPPSDNKLEVDFKTGADNLEMKPFQDNVEIHVVLKNRADAILQNANKDQNWPNNSIKRVTVPLPADITVDDIKELHVYRNRKLGGTPTTTVFNIAEKDNWNVDKITSTARIKVNGVLKMYRFADFISSTGSNPMFRFVYEGGNGRNEGQVFKGFLSNVGNGTSTSNSPNVVNAPPKIKIETLTGGDDLRGGNDNVNLMIRLNTTPARTITVSNLNNREKWDNFTEHIVTKSITAPAFTFDDIKEIALRHTGGGGIGADNWYLDKLKITLTIAGETRVLVDQVGAPIHYFTGELRSKTLQILR